MSTIKFWIFIKNRLTCRGEADEGWMLVDVGMNVGSEVKLGVFNLGI